MYIIYNYKYHTLLENVLFILFYFYNLIFIKFKTFFYPLSTVKALNLLTMHYLSGVYGSLNPDQPSIEFQYDITDRLKII